VAGGRADAVSPPRRADPEPAADTASLPQDFEALLRMVEDRNEIRLLGLLEEHVRLVAYQPGRLEIALEGDVPADFSQRLVNWLNAATGARWGVIIANAPGEETVASRRRAALAEAEAAHDKDPLLQEVRKFFPNAKVVRQDDLEALPGPPPADDEETGEK
jgi:DNA polymerase-3 subunit gamma/tau